MNTGYQGGTQNDNLLWQWLWFSLNIHVYALVLAPVLFQIVDETLWLLFIMRFHISLSTNLCNTNPEILRTTEYFYKN